MSSLLDNKILPLWAWIIIIVFGSFAVIGIVAFVARCIVVKRRKTDFLDTFGDDNLPQRRVTVRRGRTVPTSNYLSLTGSKFGLNAFLEDGDGNSRTGARSKSPFEWWSHLNKRSDSRQSYATQFTGDGSSIFASTTSPQPPQRVYQRREFQQSTTSLSTDFKDEDFNTTTSVVEVERPASPPKPPPNFSRSFSSQGHRHDRRQNKLSRIEEASPHTSMISTARQSYVASFVSSLPAHESDGSTWSPQAITTPSDIPLPSSSNVSRQASKRSSTNNMLSPMAQATLPDAPRPIAVNSARSSLNQSEKGVNFSRRSSQRSTTDASKETRSRGSSFTALPEAPEAPEAPKVPEPRQPDTLAGYWETRTDVQPIRKSSKKGNVLRKKSLRRSELQAKLSA